MPLLEEDCDSFLTSPEYSGRKTSLFLGGAYCFDGRDEVQSFLPCILLKEPKSLLIEHKADACYLKIINTVPQSGLYDQSAGYQSLDSLSLRSPPSETISPQTPSRLAPTLPLGLPSNVSLSQQACPILLGIDVLPRLP